MSASWHDFIFGAFDPAGTITVDKLPGAFWLQALSVRAFGRHPWAIFLPQAVLSGGAWWLVVAGVCVGLAFQAKMIEAWMVLPALGLAYLISGPGTTWRRVAQLAVAGVVAGLVSLSWMTAVSLVPAASRPYVDGSHDDSVYSQVFAYNGFTRFGDQTPLQLLAGELRPGAILPVPAPSPPACCTATWAATPAG